jgi:hypothetical protein
MAPILGIYASQISGHLFAPSGAYDSIATTTVGAGGSATITFSSIPQTYTHLQVRFTSLTTVNGGSPLVRFNSDSSASYSNHTLFGNGSTAGAGSNVSNSGMYVGGSDTGTFTTSPFVAVIDVLDYTSVNKNKTIRTLSGVDANGSGEINLFSGAWYNTSAISTLTITAPGRTFAEYSQFALYGVKGQ